MEVIEDKEVRTFYKAKDGRTFHDKDSCILYEKYLDFKEKFVLEGKNSLKKVYRRFFGKNPALSDVENFICIGYLKTQHEEICTGLVDYIKFCLWEDDVSFSMIDLENDIKKKISKFKFQDGMVLIYYDYQYDYEGVGHNFFIELTDHLKLMNKLKALKKDIYEGIATLKKER